MAGGSQVSRSLRRILIVDDDRNLLRSNARRLQRATYDVSIAGTRAEAMAACMEREPQLAIVDENLGGDSGSAVISELKRVQPRLVAVLHTAFCSSWITEIAIKAGADTVLPKTHEVFDAVRWYQTGVPLPEADASRGLASLDEVERDHILRVYAATQRNVSRAAKILGLARSTLQQKLDELGQRKRSSAG